MSFTRNFCGGVNNTPPSSFSSKPLRPTIIGDCLLANDFSIVWVSESFGAPCRLGKPLMISRTRRPNNRRKCLRFYERSSCAPKRRELWGPGILQEQARELDHGAGKLMPSRQTLATVEAKVKGAKLQNTRPANVPVWKGRYLKNASMPADPWGMSTST